MFLSSDFAASGRLGDDGDPEDDVMSTTDASTYDPSEDSDAFGLSRTGSDAAFEGAFDAEATAGTPPFGNADEDATTAAAFTPAEEEEAGFDVELEEEMEVRGRDSQMCRLNAL